MYMYKYNYILLFSSVEHNIIIYYVLQIIIYPNHLQ